MNSRYETPRASKETMDRLCNRNVKTIAELCDRSTKKPEKYISEKEFNEFLKLCEKESRRQQKEDMEAGRSLIRLIVLILFFTVPPLGLFLIICGGLK